MQHGVAVDAVILDVAALRGVDGSAEVALVVENVVKLQHHRQRLALEEALCYLRVPHQLVRVHRLVAVAASAVLVQVGAEAHAPRRVYRERAAIGKLPCVEVGLALQLVARVGVVE